MNILSGKRLIEAWNTAEMELFNLCIDIFQWLSKIVVNLIEIISNAKG